MKILFVPSDNNRYHGAFLCMVRVASILQEKYGHTVIVALTCDGDGKELLDNSNIKSILVPSYNWAMPLAFHDDPFFIGKQIIKRVLNLRPIWQLIRIIKEEQIDIVHINTSWTYIGAAAAAYCNIPFIWHIREFLEEGQQLTIWNKRHAYKLMKKADRVVTVSHSLYEKYLPVLRQEQLTVILDGVDPQRYLNTSHIIFERSPFRFLIVGGVYLVKRQEEIIQACISLIKDGFTSFSLTIAGDDTSAYAKELKTLVDSNRLNDHIRFLGNIENVDRLYKESDISFMCSKYEGFGRVTVEAMLGGSLVIGARSGGTLDIIREGETGLLYTSGDIRDLKEKILYAIQHPEEMRRMAKHGHTDALTRLNEDVNASSINTLYVDVLKDHNI